MTDLPGLTSVAITDRGQPKNMKEQLTNLIVKYTTSPSTLIMAIIPARPDIEADMSMELIKQIDPKGERTIGILTKLDLMNEDTDIHNYLENKVSKDLMLSYGYYGIRNKSYPTIAETISSEKSYIASHPIYKQEKYQSRLGITQVASSLSSPLKISPLR
jgi:dynamin 1-like protein